MHAKAQETESEAKIQFAFLECQEGYENKYTTFKQIHMFTAVMTVLEFDSEANKIQWILHPNKNHERIF